MEKEPLLTQVWEIVTTLSNEESATGMAKSLLESRLAACVQIAGPLRSLYRWQSAIQEDEEWKLTIKTSHDCLPACCAAIARNHPYEVPELLARPFAHVTPSYEHWLLGQLVVPAQMILAKPWHIRIACRPLNAIGHLQVTINGQLCETLVLPMGADPLPTTFEFVSQQFSTFPRLHFEPDGSFVWTSVETGASEEGRWQLDGMVYDRENHIEYVELKGSCDRPHWEKMMRGVSGVEYIPLMVQWVEQGLWISEEDFRKWIV